MEKYCSILLAMAAVGAGTFVVSFFLRPSLKAIWHSVICAGCCGLFLLNIAPFVASIYFLEGYKAAVVERWEFAIRFYNKALEYDSRDGELNFYTGFAWMKKKNYHKAIYHFKRSLEVKPDPSAFNNLGNVYLEQGEFEKAENAYKNALYTRVSLIYSLNNLGALYQKTGRLDQSFELFKKALKINPDYEIARKNLEVVKNLRQKYACIKKRYGENFLRYFFTAQSYLRYKREDKAKDFFLKAKDILLEKDRGLGPGDREWNEVRRNRREIFFVYSVVGSNLVKLDSLREAISLYETVLNFKPGNIKQLYRYIASLYMKLGEEEKAQRMLEKAQSL